PYQAAAAAFAAQMANGAGNMIGTSCTAFPAPGSIPAARPAMATNVAVTSSDGPGWRRKNQDRARPAGRRSSHHLPPRTAPGPAPASAVSSLGVVLVIWLRVAQLVLRDRGRFRRLDRGGHRTVPSRLLGGDLRRKHVIVHRLFEAMNALADGCLARLSGLRFLCHGGSLRR